MKLTVIQFAQVPPLLAPAKNVKNKLSEAYDQPKRPSLLPRDS
jgi:hypothetical protein